MSVTPLRQQMPEEDHAQSTPDINETSTESAKTKRTRGRSTIEFPYADLDDAVSVARTIRDKGGVPLAKDQLAAAMGQPVTSGAFSAKVHASRLFGVIEFAMGKIKLTDLGFEVVEGDDSRAKAAKVKAFLNVPLFAKAYGEFRNRQLPPRPLGLEQAFIGYGVLKTRGVNARWAFDRSARQAGFFDNGEDRLVHPIITWVERAEVHTHAPEVDLTTDAESDPVTKTASTAAEEFLIRGLLARMPSPSTKWSLSDRARWLRTLSMNLAMLYGDIDEAEIQITLPKPAPAVATAPSHPEPKPKTPDRERLIFPRPQQETEKRRRA